jgi:hypothetical protein
VIDKMIVYAYEMVFFWIVVIFQTEKVYKKTISIFLCSFL